MQPLFSDLDSHRMLWIFWYSISITSLAHATIDPPNILIPHIIHPLILPMIVNLRCQFRTIKSVFFIERSRLHSNFLIIAWWCEWRTAIRTELAHYLSAPVAAVQVHLGWPLGVLETGFWHDNVGGKAGAGIAFAVGAVTDNHLVTLLVNGISWFLLEVEISHTLGNDSLGNIMRYTMFLQRQAPVRQFGAIVVVELEFQCQGFWGI